MTITQMECFLVVAKCQNMSEAAKRLYLTQPTLSRQIISMEGELNLQLFYRGKKGLQLTPAGRRLADCFQTILADYRNAVEQAKTDQLGISGELNIGILEGHMVGDFFPELLVKFRQQYPNLQVNVRRHSFSGLVEGLYDRSLHLIFTMEFDMEGRPGLSYIPFEEAENRLVVHIAHPKASLPNPTLADFKDSTFIINAPEDCENGLAELTLSCQKAGFTPNYKFAPSLGQMMLWTEAGYGVAVLSRKNSLSENPNLCFLTLPEIHPSNVVLAWNEDTIDPKVLIGLEITKQVCQLQDPK